MVSGLVILKGFGRKETLCKALSWHLPPGRTEENKEKYKSGQLVLQQRYKPGNPQHTSVALPLHQPAAL
jgi:hypothetical protein